MRLCRHRHAEAPASRGACVKRSPARHMLTKTRSMACSHNHDWPNVRNAKCPQPRFTAVRAQQSSSCISVSRLLPINSEVGIVTK